MNSTNPNRENSVGAQYSQSNAGYMHQSPQYKHLDTMTSKPNAPMSVLNPYDRTYRTFINAFNNNLLHPNQSSNPQNYYTIDSAYGQSPLKTQTIRSCSGNF